jgi:hypothetical protein
MRGGEGPGLPQRPSPAHLRPPNLDCPTPHPNCTASSRFQVLAIERGEDLGFLSIRLNMPSTQIEGGWFEGVGPGRVGKLTHHLRGPGAQPIWALFPYALWASFT